MSEFDFTCPDCGSDVLPDPTSFDGWDDGLADGEIFIDLTCRECGTEFFAAFKFDKYIITYREEDE